MSKTLADQIVPKELLSFSRKRLKWIDGKIAKNKGGGYISPGLQIPHPSPEGMCARCSTVLGPITVSSNQPTHRCVDGASSGRFIVCDSYTHAYDRDVLVIAGTCMWFLTHASDMHTATWEACSIVIILFFFLLCFLLLFFIASFNFLFPASTNQSRYSFLFFLTMLYFSSFIFFFINFISLFSIKFFLSFLYFSFHLYVPSIHCFK